MPQPWTPLLTIQAAIAIICVVGLFIVVVLLMFFEPPAKNETMINIVLGALVSVGFANIVGFFFGQKEQSDQATKKSAPITVDPPATINFA